MLNKTYLSNNSILVIGGTGVIGSAFINYIKKNKDVTCISISRKTEIETTKTSYFTIDLQSFNKNINLDISYINKLSKVTHVVYSAYSDADTITNIRTINNNLFKNTLSLINRYCPSTEHITLLQGMKAYGSHLGYHKTPSQESDQRTKEKNFYYDQEDYLKKNSKKVKYNWTILRPHAVIGPKIGTPMNLLMFIAIYANICKFQNLPLIFPGPLVASKYIYQATDSNILAKAIEWAGTSKNTVNQIYNITNGDYFRWEHMWPKIAQYFEMDYSFKNNFRISDGIENYFDDVDNIWKRISKKEHLIISDLNQLISFKFANYVFNIDWDVMADTTKAREAGFNEFINSEKMFVKKFNELKLLNIIPSS